MGWKNNKLQLQKEQQSHHNHKCRLTRKDSLVKSFTKQAIEEEKQTEVQNNCFKSLFYCLFNIQDEIHFFQVKVKKPQK